MIKSCVGDVYSFWVSFKQLKHLLRIPLKLILSNISMIKQLSLTIRLPLVCCSLEHMVVNTVNTDSRLHSLAKLEGQSFSDFKLCAAVKPK